MRTSRLLTLFALFAALSCATASSTRVSAAEKTYHRFWRGYRKADVTPDAFVKALNAKFIPATVSTGAGKGLIAYQPALPPQGPVQGLPDEIALVSYQSEEAYQALRKTPEGQAYANSHWELFSRETSSSVVPGEFQGEVALGKAYDLRPGFTDWQHGSGVAVITPREAGLSDAEYLSRIAGKLAAAARNPQLRDEVALVDPQYMIEYQSWVSQPEPVAGAVPLRPTLPEQAALRAGAGANVSF